MQGNLIRNREFLIVEKEKNKDMVGDIEMSTLPTRAKITPSPNVVEDYIVQIKLISKIYKIT